MYKNKFLLMIIFLLMQIAPVLAEDNSFLNREAIGDFSLGQSEKELKNNIHCTIKRGPDTWWGADGVYHQTWDCYDAGISFSMVFIYHSGRAGSYSATLAKVGAITLEDYE